MNFAYCTHRIFYRMRVVLLVLFLYFLLLLLLCCYFAQKANTRVAGPLSSLHGGSSGMIQKFLLIIFILYTCSRNIHRFSLVGTETYLVMNNSRVSAVLVVLFSENIIETEWEQKPVKNRRRIIIDVPSVVYFGFFISRSKIKGNQIFKSITNVLKVY